MLTAGAKNECALLFQDTICMKLIDNKQAGNLHTGGDNSASINRKQEVNGHRGVCRNRVPRIQGNPVYISPSNTGEMPVCSLGPVFSNHLVSETSGWQLCKAGCLTLT